MSIIERIRADQLAARKAGEKEKAVNLATLLAEAVNVGRSKGNRETTDAEAVSVILKFTGNLDLFIGHTDDPALTAKLRAEKSVYSAYLPASWTEDEIRAAAAGWIEANPTANFGSAMKAVKGLLPGPKILDMNLVKAVVQPLVG